MALRSNLFAAAIVIFSTQYFYSSNDCLSGQNSRYAKSIIEKRYPESESIGSKIASVGLFSKGRLIPTNILGR